jgi:hypothetical protein
MAAALYNQFVPIRSTLVQYGSRVERLPLRLSFLLACCLGLLGSTAVAQTADSPTLAIVIHTETLPKAFLQQPYEIRMAAEGGIPPLAWKVTEGDLPAGLALQHDGLLDGIPTETGEFRFTVTVTDSGHPAYQKSQQIVLKVVAPLLAQWGRYPKVNGRRLEGSILVSNATDHDFDLTVIVLAVNHIGRATALGYQHFPLSKDTAGMEIPFGDNLPHGAYDLNVDAVAEVAATDSIFRARLAPKEKFDVVLGP